MNAPLPPGRRVVVAEFGETPLEAIDTHLTLEAMPAPDPATLAPGDVIVAVKSAAVGWVDLLMTSGQYQHMPKPPYCPGLEYAGEVAWTSAGNRFRVGDRVLVDGFLAGPRSLGSYQAYGGFASYAVAPESALLPVPGALSFDEASNLLGNYETAYHCLVTRGRLRAGETVLIHGAAGSTGLAAVHLAKLLGARVIATGRSDAKLAVVKANGADHVINCKGETSSGVRPFRDEVKALTAGRGVDVVYDGVGGDISLESLRCVAFGARFLIVGWASTPFVARGKGERGAPNANLLPTNLIMMKGLDVLGCPTVISTVNDPSLGPPRRAQVLKWVEEGRIRPHVGRVFPLAEFKDAMRAKWNGEVVGGCVLHP
jgi:NADPH2:quinone reductase